MNQIDRVYLPFGSVVFQPGVVALKERYLRHVKAPTRPQGERTMQLHIVRKDRARSGQEELRSDSLTVTVKDGAEEPVATKPGVDTHVRPGGVEAR